MQELRIDPLTGLRVLIADERTDRPGGGLEPPPRRPVDPAGDPFAAGHEDRTIVISRDRGYHGTNLGGTSAQGLAPNREGWGPLVPEIVQVPADAVLATLHAGPPFG